MATDIQHVLSPTDCNIQAEVVKTLSVFRLETLKLAIDLTSSFGPGITIKSPFISTDMVRLGQCIVVSSVLLCRSASHNLTDTFPLETISRTFAPMPFDSRRLR